MNGGNATVPVGGAPSRGLGAFLSKVGGWDSLVCRALNSRRVVSTAVIGVV